MCKLLFRLFLTLKFLWVSVIDMILDFCRFELSKKNAIQLKSFYKAFMRINMNIKIGIHYLYNIFDDELRH
ncbi:hypothetical protein AWE51_03800 [Aquimarina aggregata]|uniref:Uncharacterized protein n=1 Tax=Aquimarina aggregata TaxID=1642818 RepID=A0A162DMB2_9FLAO|nr:hypothetical protein AWE51_03800 [Aquimarina aggregata]